jgi:serine phosphatase RsbU (regulator of sigma subunit)
MSECFRMAAPLGAEAVLTRMLGELRQFTGDGPQMDDITLVSIEKRSPPEAAANRTTPFY